MLIERCPDESTRKSFEGKKVIQAKRQPTNLLRMLTSAKFNNDDDSTNQIGNGIFRCKRSNCDLCRDYLMECKTFMVEGGKIWEVRSRITCGSKNVIYFQRCNFCSTESNIGKTNNLRLRTNNHKTLCKTGEGTDKFDRHIYLCNKDPEKKGPYFKLWVMLEVDDPSKLLVYENYFHRCGYDTTNRGKPE